MRRGHIAKNTKNDIFMQLINYFMLFYVEV